MNIRNQKQSFYQIKADGVAYPVDDSMTTPFACVIFFDADRKIPVWKGMNYTQFQDYLGSSTQEKNICNPSPLGSPHLTTHHFGGWIELRPDHFDKSLSFLLCRFVGA
ncbi:MAG TPA: hypothetical protein C5S37_12375 [Methanophagales archaeon]|nr:hypothetical protein [Methanophagales archaeon]